MQDLKASIQADIANEKIIVYSKSYCPYAGATKQLLNSNNVTYKLVELDQVANGTAIQDALKDISGQRTVPNVFIGGKHIGGNSDVQALNSQGKLGQTLSAAGVTHSF